MDFVSLNGVTLAYQLRGPADGKPLVFVNSLGTDARIWDDVVAELAPRYRILTYDKRGHGLSDSPAGPYLLDDLAADLAALTAHLGPARFTLCGVSVGGMIAQLFATQYPDRLDALVLCNTAAKIGELSFWQARINSVQSGGIASISEAVLDRWFSPGFRATRPDQYRGYRNMLERTDAQGYAATCAAIGDADLRSAIGSIATPTLVLAGEHDKSTPPELVRDTAAMIHGTRFRVIDGSGHIPSIERPGLLAALIDEHVQEAHHV